MTTDWPFHDTYRVDLPPTQVKAAVERCKKKNIVDLSAPSELTLAILNQVTEAYNRKKTRAREASARSRTTAKSAAEAEPLDIEVEPTEEAACVVCEIVAEQAPEPPAPEPTAAPPPVSKAALSKAAKRADNVAPTHPASEAPPAPAAAPQKRPAASEAPARRRGGGLAAIVAEISLNA